MAIAAAIVAGVVAAVSLWPTDTARELDDVWTITPVGTPVFEVIDHGRIRLTSGELHVQSVSESAEWPITVETAAGEAHAKGTEFYIGALQPMGKGDDMNRTRVLILAGKVTLANSVGSIEGQTDELLSSESKTTPVKLAVRANNRFAFDLYEQLSADSGDDNLFFSPYSIEAALAMLLEGARAQTAFEIGNVLRLPDDARRIGEGAQRIPWQTSLLHIGMSRLNQQLAADSSDDAETRKLKQDIARLETKRADNLAALKEIKDRVRQDKAAKRDQAVRQAISERIDREIEIVEQLNQLYPQLSSHELSIGNALWCDRRFPLRENYVDVLRSTHGTDAFDADFRENAAAEHERINAWVAQQTKNRIRDILPAGSINEHTPLVLANAIYFRGSWEKPFSERRTKDSDFTLSDGSTTTVAMMRQNRIELRYAELSSTGVRVEPVYDEEAKRYRIPDNHNGVQLVALPYQGGDLSMLIVLPRRHDGLADVQARLNADTLDAWISQLRSQTVHVNVPRWRTETTCDLSQTLADLGMLSAFQPGGLTGLSDSTDADKLFLSVVVHKGFIEVNEKGTEVAVATGVATKDAEQRMPTPLVKADHPFLFFIRS